MDWQKAVKLSPVNKAVRKTEDGRVVIINKYGLATIYKHHSSEYRDAFPREYIGCKDWHPMDE